ncbi:hypothetical protein BRADI_1g37544v3 [Brachypodium distachyon]|uniref:Uncharacterized protein n=1 Tax=Brachypodium distachyon TaxID=15368 RepID=A0A2K2DN73_BRADI|nr:hypothetical protein BRADI_1g37544v3 [Brachypodium distachyon]
MRRCHPSSCPRRRRPASRLRRCPGLRSHPPLDPSISAIREKDVKPPMGKMKMPTSGVRATQLRGRRRRSPFAAWCRRLPTLSFSLSPRLLLRSAVAACLAHMVVTCCCRARRAPELRPSLASHLGLNSISGRAGLGSPLASFGRAQVEPGLARLASRPIHG